MTSHSIRLNKFISDSGYCSRREADKLIEQSRVRINGKRPELGARVEPGDDVTVNGSSIGMSAGDKTDRIYISCNKPIGVTCTTERSVKGNIVDAIGHSQRIFPIGRLDKDSEGLILLTNDGDIVNRILRAENAHEKEYLVRVDKPLSKDFAEKMATGVPILDRVTQRCQVEVQDSHSFKIVLTQGLNRQIRRMCEYFGYEVQQLTRIRIMNIQLGRLRPGQWRDLTPDEMLVINSALQDSTSEARKKPEKKTKSAKSTQHHRRNRNRETEAESRASVGGGGQGKPPSRGTATPKNTKTSNSGRPSSKAGVKSGRKPEKRKRPTNSAVKKSKTRR